MSEYLYTHDALTVPRGDDAGQLLAPRPPCDADSQLDVAAFRDRGFLILKNAADSDAIARAAAYVATHEACWSAPSGTRPDDWRMHRDQHLDAPLSVGRQLRPCCPRQPPGPHQIDLHRAGDVLLLAGLKQEADAAEHTGAVDQTVKTTEMGSGGIDPALSRSWFFCRIGVQQHTITACYCWIEHGSFQSHQVPQPQTQAMAISQSSLSNGTADTAASATDQEGAHGDKHCGLHR